MLLSRTTIEGDKFKSKQYNYLIINTIQPFVNFTYILNILYFIDAKIVINLQRNFEILIKTYE